MIDPSLPLRHPSTTPPSRGLYVRDWRGTLIDPASERRLWIDLWDPEPDKRDILWPGVWYTWPGPNDASQQRLPWREATHEELRDFEAEHGPLYLIIGD